jgi:hypothetical protein
MILATKIETKHVYLFLTSDIDIQNLHRYGISEKSKLGISFLSRLLEAKNVAAYSFTTPGAPSKLGITYR